MRAEGVSACGRLCGTFAFGVFSAPRRWFEKRWPENMLHRHIARDVKASRCQDKEGDRRHREPLGVLSSLVVFVFLLTVDGGLLCDGKC